jgi:hypothetical protein
MFHKYRAGDLRLALWLRLNSRLGMCLALANAALYLVLISFILYISSYWSVQLATSPRIPKALNILNRAGEDLEATGMADVGCAIDSMPAVYYETADLAGTLYNNPALKERLNDYPPFIALAEQPDFQGLAGDTQLAQAWQSRTSIDDLIKNASINSILKNPDLLKSFWGALEPDLHDLGSYLVTGQSPKYDSETILGRWNFNVNATIGLLRRSRPNIPSKEMARLKNRIAMEFSRTTFVAMPDHGSILKNFPHTRTAPGTPPVTEMLNVPGRWKNLDGRYALTYSPEGRAEEVIVDIERDRLTITGQGLELAFDRED